MSRKIEDLNPVVAGMVRTLIITAKQKLNLDIEPTRTLSTEAEQLAYFAQGRKTFDAVNSFRKQAGLGPITSAENRRIVTQLLTSIHQYGCACDFVIDRDPAPGLQKPVWDTKADINENEISDYEEIGKIAEAIGFRWGGRFSFRDLVHIEYTGGLKLADLQAGKRPHEEKEA